MQSETKKVQLRISEVHEHCTLYRARHDSINQSIKFIYQENDKRSKRERSSKEP